MCCLALMVTDTHLSMIHFSYLPYQIMCTVIWKHVKEKVALQAEH
jgi:hypothetical protein